MRVSAAKANEAAEVLAVELNSLTVSILARAYRSKAKECHPDHHGSEKLQMWARVSWACECLKNWLEHTQPVKEAEGTDIQVTGDCRACNGSGRVRLRKTAGFSPSLTIICILCNGAGTLSIDRDNEGGVE